jgi:threonine synthase
MPPITPNPQAHRPRLVERFRDFLPVTDEEILAAYRDLSRMEGEFCEPASAASVAGVVKAAAGQVDRDATVVCVLTGNGLKDPVTAEAGLTVNVTEAEPTSAGVAQALGWT